MKKEIIILGCGFSGMLTALAFAKQNIKTIILEYQSISSSNFTADIRTTALTPYSVSFLKSINIWNKLIELVGKMLEVYVVDNKAPEMLWFKDNKKNDPLGYIISNNDFKKILLDAVKNNPLIKIIDQFEYSKVETNDNYTTIHYGNNQLLQSDLLIVCNGPNSKVRSHYFINKIEKIYHQIALTFNVKHSKEHENCAMEHFLPSGPFAILPLKDPFCSSVIWTIEEKQALLLLSLAKEEIEYLVNKNCGNSLGTINIDSKISSFPLKAYLTNKYFYNKIVLIADSAHLIHPLAGQGLNHGIKDIIALSQLIQDRGISKDSLIQYQKLREEDNLAIYMITDNLNNIFSNHLKSLWYFRRLGLKTIDNLQFVKDYILQYAMGYR